MRSTGNLDLNFEGTSNTADEDGTSISTLTQIFSDTPKEVIVEAVRKANGSVSLAAQDLLEGKSCQI